MSEGTKFCDRRELAVPGLIPGRLTGSTWTSSTIINIDWGSVIEVPRQYCLYLFDTW